MVVVDGDGLVRRRDALGVLELQFNGWATRDQTAQFLWDLLFYEPWFLGLAILTTLGTVHHYRRTGGTARRPGRLRRPRRGRPAPGRARGPRPRRRRNRRRRRPAPAARWRSGRVGPMGRAATTAARAPRAASPEPR